MRSKVISTHYVFQHFRSSSDEKSLESLTILIILAFHEEKTHQYALRFSVFGSSSDEKSLDTLRFSLFLHFMRTKSISTHYVFQYLGARLMKNH